MLVGAADLRTGFSVERTTVVPVVDISVSITVVVRDLFSVALASDLFVVGVCFPLLLSAFVFFSIGFEVRDLSVVVRTRLRGGVTVERWYRVPGYSVTRAVGVRAVDGSGRCDVVEVLGCFVVCFCVLRAAVVVNLCRRVIGGRPVVGRWMGVLGARVGWGVFVVVATRLRVVRRVARL